MFHSGSPLKSPDLSWHLYIALRVGKASSPDFQQANWATEHTLLPDLQSAPGKPWDTGWTDGTSLLGAASVASVPAYCLPRRPSRLIILWDTVCEKKAQEENTNRITFKWLHWSILGIADISVLKGPVQAAIWFPKSPPQPNFLESEANFLKWLKILEWQKKTGKKLLVLRHVWICHFLRQRTLCSTDLKHCFQHWEVCWHGLTKGN